MPSPLKSELARILGALRIESPQAFTFAGRRIELGGTTLPQIPNVAAVQNPLIAAVQTQLYQNCYCRRFTGVLEDPSPSGNGDRDLTEDLSRANASHERWEGGWQVTRLLPSGQVGVQRNGLSRLLWPGEYLTADGPGGMPRQGGHVSVFCRKHSTALQPGFYFAFGETLPDQQDEASPVRFYWNVTEAGITELLGAVTRELNRFQIPFRMKCPVRAAYYSRTDAAVLYVARRLYHVVAELLAAVYASVAPRLRRDTPLFARTLAPGLGLAEDPANGESFGAHRCRLVAEAVWNSHAQDRHSVEARLEAVEKQFQLHGLSLESSHLNRGSRDCYHWPVAEVSLQ